MARHNRWRPSRANCLQVELSNPNREWKLHNGQSDSPLTENMTTDRRSSLVCEAEIHALPLQGAVSTLNPHGKERSSFNIKARGQKPHLAHDHVILYMSRDNNTLGRESCTRGTEFQSHYRHRLQPKGTDSSEQSVLHLHYHMFYWRWPSVVSSKCRGPDGSIWMRVPALARRLLSCPPRLIIPPDGTNSHPGALPDDSFRGSDQACGGDPV